MKIHGDDMIAPRRLKHIGHQLRGDRSSTLILLILACIREVRQDCCDAPCGGSAASVDEDKKLHDMVVDVARLGGLDDEDCTKLSV